MNSSEEVEFVEPSWRPHDHDTLTSDDGVESFRAHAELASSRVMPSGPNWNGDEQAPVAPTFIFRACEYVQGRQREDSEAMSDTDSNIDLESPEANLICAILATYFEDLRSFRRQRSFAKTTEAAEICQKNIDWLITQANSKYTEYLCGLVMIDHDWFFEKVMACATGQEPDIGGRKVYLRSETKQQKLKRRLM